MDKVYKFALNAGHGLHTAGKRVPRELDPKETREWQLNSRICDKITALLQGYTGWEMLRLDDPTGAVDAPLEERTDAANAWGAQEYYSVHHNANEGRPWNGGGIAVYVYTNASAAAKAMQSQLYEALIRNTGLKGNRATPLGTANFHELRETKMPAVLMELGFMDSRVDAPIILTEEYADQCAAAIAEIIVQRGRLKPKATTPYLVRVTAQELNVRAGAGTIHKIVTQVKKGEVYTIMETVNGWGRLKSGLGWISLRYCEEL